MYIHARQHTPRLTQTRSAKGNAAFAMNHNLPPEKEAGIGVTHGLLKINDWRV